MIKNPSFHAFPDSGAFFIFSFLCVCIYLGEGCDEGYSAASLVIVSKDSIIIWCTLEL